MDEEEAFSVEQMIGVLKQAEVGVEADLISLSRMLYQLEGRETGWKILPMKTIYERDTLNPTIPGTTLDVDSEKITEFSAPYRFWLTT